MNTLVDNFAKDAVKPLQKVLKAKQSNAHQKVHALWALHRLGALDEKLLENAAQDKSRDVRVHVMRVLGATEKWSTKQRAIALGGLKDSDAYVQRAAAEASGYAKNSNTAEALLQLRVKVPSDDSQLTYVARMALRNQLADGLPGLLKRQLTEADSRAIADVVTGIKTEAAGEFLLTHLSKYSESREKVTEFLRHAARYAPEARMADVAKFTRSKFVDDLDFQLALFKSVEEGTQQRGGKLDPTVAEWGADLAGKLLASVDLNSLDWRNSPNKGKDTRNPWVLQERPSADGKPAQVISSFAPGGESYTGTLRSKPFTLPVKLSFYICGHDGSPEKPALKKNFVRLRLADSNKVLKEVVPPRNDTAQPIVWDLKEHAGKKAFLEVVDNNSGHAYAWLGIGRLDPEVVPLPKVIPNQVDKRQVSAAELAESLKLTSLESQLAALLNNPDADVDARAASAKALSSFSANKYVSDFARILNDGDEPMKLRERSAQTLAQVNTPQSRDVLITTLRAAPQQLTTQIGLALAGNGEGAEALLKAAEDRKISAHVLQETTVKDRLAASKPNNFQTRFDQLTKNLTPLSQEKQKIIDARRAAFLAAEPSVEKGAQVFAQTCMACHQMGGKGALIGPQLDGVGNRGADRLIEDILDPNRNVDAAFRYSNVTLKDDRMISGLFRREAGEVLVFADGTGKEVSIAKKDIAERRESENSLMPDNFADSIPEEDFNGLIAYLLAEANKGKLK